MNISDMPEVFAEFLKSKNLLNPKECFSNCMGALIHMISNDDYDVNYVLCGIKAKDGSVLEHAVLRLNSEYVDPTLEVQNLHRKVDYFIEKEFSTEEVMKMNFDKFGMPKIKKMLEGTEPVWPLSKIGENQYDFLDV